MGYDERKKIKGRKVIVLSYVAISTKGNFKNSMKFLKNIRERKYLEKAKAYAEEGLKRIKDATPVATGKTRDSWYYTIEDNGKDIKISWCNDNSADGIPIVLLIFYGHGTKNGGYVPGYDFLSPAIQPIMDKLVENVWEGVLK